MSESAVGNMEDRNGKTLRKTMKKFLKIKRKL
jgi:hypothetical protein